MTQSSFLVLMHRQSGEFIFSQHNRSEDGTFRGAGAYWRCNADQMKQHGPYYSQLLFDVTDVRTFEDASEIETASKGGRNEFYKTHRAVWMFHPAPDEIVFWPMRPVWQGDQVISVYLAPEDASHLPWPTSPENFFENLMAAFEITR